MANEFLAASSPILNMAMGLVNNEHFGELQDDKQPASIQILYIIIGIMALYLAFKCKGYNGNIDIFQIILACLCSPCYVAYRLAVPC